MGFHLQLNLSYPTSMDSCYSVAYVNNRQLPREVVFMLQL